MKDKFSKTLGKLGSRKPVSTKKFESLTGTDYEQDTLKDDLMSQYKNEVDEEKKKKIKQRAHLMGITLE